MKVLRDKACKDMERQIPSLENLKKEALDSNDFKGVEENIEASRKELLNKEVELPKHISGLSTSDISQLQASMNQQESVSRGNQNIYSS